MPSFIHIIEYMNTLYEKRYISFAGVCPKTAPSQGYTICKYVNWIGMHGRIGDKNSYRKHLHMFFIKAHFYNLSRFRLGVWKLNVNNVNHKHIKNTITIYYICIHMLFFIVRYYLFVLHRFLVWSSPRNLEV